MIREKDAIEWASKGHDLYALGRYEEAIQCYDKALQIKPNFAGAWSNRGVTLDEIGQFEEAIKSYDKALATKPVKTFEMMPVPNVFLEEGSYYTLVWKSEAFLVENTSVTLVRLAYSSVMN